MMSSSRFAHIFFTLPEKILVPYGTDISAFSRKNLAHNTSALKSAAQSIHLYTLDYPFRDIMSQSGVAMAFMLMGAEQGEAAREKFMQDTIKPFYEGLTKEVTVAHVQQEIVGAGDPDIQSMETEAIDTINLFLDAHSLANSQSCRFLSWASLPVLTTYAIQIGNHLDYQVNGEVTKLDTYVNFSERTENVERAAAVHHRSLKHGILSTTADTAREGSIAYSDGNYLSACIFFAVAAESMMQELIELLWWEKEHLTQTDALIRLEGAKSFSHLMSNEMGELVGGNWDQTKVGSPAYLWREDIANLRNKSVHQGYRPTNHEAERAMLAYKTLWSDILALLRATAHSHPTTSSIFLAEEQLLIDAPDTHLDSSISEFLKWREGLHSLKAAQRAAKKAERDADRMGSNKARLKIYKRLAYRVQQHIRIRTGESTTLS